MTNGELKNTINILQSSDNKNLTKIQEAIESKLSSGYPCVCQEYFKAVNTLLKARIILLTAKESKEKTQEIDDYLEEEKISQKSLFKNM